MSKYYSQLNKKRGIALLLLAVLFTAVSITILLGTTSPVIRQIQMARDVENSQKSYFLAEAGAEDAFYRMQTGKSITFPLNVLLEDEVAEVNSSVISFSEQQITSQGEINDHIRTVLKEIRVTTGFSFQFGIQTGIGGLYLYNNARVNGNVYANGPVVGGNSNPNSYSIVGGSVVSATENGLVRYINASSSVYAHNIDSVKVGQNAYYQNITNSTVGGLSFPGSADQPAIGFPISDETIAEWESEAESGGSVVCSGGVYIIDSSVTLGPKKIPCNLTVSGNGTVLTLTGPLWVVGNLTISGSGGSGVQIRVADSIGDRSVVMVVDDPANKVGGGRIAISGNSNFYGSTGNEDSYVMLVSANTSAESGGSALAIDVINGATGNLLVFAPHGEIRLQNNVNLREVTSYKLSVYNNAVVNYLIGLSQPLFTSGPGGTWKIKRWREI